MRNPHAAAQTPWSDDVRRSLLAERLAVALERNDAALRAGRHTEVLVDLIVETRARPLDERLSGQPTPAPSRSGRQAAAYQAIRWRLLNELGVDPGAELRGSQQLILSPDAPSSRAGDQLGQPWCQVVSEPGSDVTDLPVCRLLRGRAGR